MNMHISNPAVFSTPDGQMIARTNKESKIGLLTLIKLAERSLPHQVMFAICAYGVAQQTPD